MKKITPKKKAAQGCRKISSFFKKQSPTTQVTKPNETITIEDDDEEEESESLLNPKYGKRRLSVSGITPPGKKTPQPSTSGLTEAIEVSEITSIAPSTSGGTPVKIRVKTPEKLFNLNKLENPKTPKKSPSKNTPKSASKSPRSSSKTTPKKLFNKSPPNISQFNVEVLRNFVKITPTKKEVEDNEARRMETQLRNEKTPTKTPNNSPASKVKPKLDFEKFTSTSTKEKFPSPSSSTKENIDPNNCSPNFDDFWESMDEYVEFNLDLNESKHCKIINLNKKSSEIIITVKSTQTNEQALCVLQDFWMHHNLCIGDTIHLKAIKQNDNWLIDNKNGFLVYEPDSLISTTAIVNSVFCKRRTVFSEKFKGFDPTNKFMIIGNMVHTLLQDVLRQNLYLTNHIKACALKILQKNEWIRQIYESGESMEFITEEFLNYVPKVHDFVDTYIKELKPHQKGNWKGTISGIEDIEENIWCPDLGVKGKVDVSIKHQKSIMPLEVKTGRATVSIEHRGQVLLYLMMMSKLNYPVSSGLLLYLKEGILKEIPSSAAEKRDLIILRNELAYYLLKVPKVEKTEEGICVEPAEVPAPIDHPSCTKCPYNAICMAYSSYTNEDLTEKKNLNKVHNDLSNFLTSTHIDYFMHWSSMLSMEMPQRGKTKDLRDIYTLPPEQRLLKGKCLINLTITSVIEEQTGVCVTTFEAEENSSQSNFLLKGFIEGGYVIVSLIDRPAVATGFIQNISIDSITVSLDRDLLKKHKNRRFFLDSYDSTTFLTYNSGSLALILDTNERANKLRSIIVDRQPATFQLKLPRALADKAKPILKRLNRVQQRAVLKAMAANEYFLIKGMPGTGKTATIVALIQILVATDKTVLITSHTHSAVDTVCLKLIDYGVKFMRLGSEAKMDQNLRPYSEHNLTKHCTSPIELEEVYNSMQVIAVTCLGSGHALLSKRILDVCIVDESTQVLQCSVFRPIFAAKTFILLGDPDQLPTVVRDKTCMELGMGESLFERLDSEESRISLNINYRMNSSITELANKLTYNGELEIGADRIANATLNIPDVAGFKDGWLIKALDTRLENAVQLIDTGAVWNLNKTTSWSQYSEESESEDNQKNINIYEAAIVYRLVQALIKGSVPASHIGVIATYRVQVAILTYLLKSTGVDVNTVDQFQGKDNNVIIYSCSKSKDLSQNWVENKFDITEDKRRLNVAITRAKHKLIIVGDWATLQNYSTFKRIKEVLERNVFRLDQCEGFDWDSVLDFDV